MNNLGLVLRSTLQIRGHHGIHKGNSAHNMLLSIKAAIKRLTTTTSFYISLRDVGNIQLKLVSAMVFHLFTIS